MGKLILTNLFGYDLLIVLLAVINAFVVYPRAKRASTHLKDLLQPKIYIPITLLMARIKDPHPDKLDLNSMKSMHADEIHYYSIFTSINSAFPMMGMLGTILSLLGLLNMSQAQVTLNFTTALTSTFWGLIFALLFKAVDATLSPVVDQNQENLKMILERMDLASRTEDAYAEK